MTTHKDTTIEQQYRRAPLNGLLIGTIVGAAWALGFMLPTASWLGNHSGRGKMALIALIIPLLGWLTGIWERTVRNCSTLAGRKRRIRLIGATMATPIGIILTIVYYFFAQGSGSRNIPKCVAFSRQAFAVYLASLIFFPIAGWILGAIRTNIHENDGYIILRMSIMAVFILFLTVFIWIMFGTLLSFNSFFMRFC